MFVMEVCNRSKAPLGFMMYCSGTLFLVLSPGTSLACSRGEKWHRIKICQGAPDGFKIFLTPLLFRLWKVTNNCYIRSIFKCRLRLEFATEEPSIHVSWMIYSLFYHIFIHQAKPMDERYIFT